MGKQIRITAPTAEGAILRLLDVCNPADIATAVDLFIERLDQLAGDPDLEPNGDELDGADAEDEEGSQTSGAGRWRFGPGCPYAECGADQYSAGDPSWTEWQTRGCRKLDRFGAELVGQDRHGNMIDEDAEDDDPAENVGDERDGCNAEDEILTDGAVRWASGRPGCAASDPEDATYAEAANRPDCLRGYSCDDEEPWHLPPTMDAPSVANDQVRA